MITVGMNYEVLPGKEPVFEDAFSDVLQALEGNEGHLASTLFRDVFKENTYLILSEWTSKNAFIEFIRSPVFQKVTDWGRDEVLASHPHHQIYERTTKPSHVEVDL